MELIDLLRANQHDKSQPVHLSSSSITLHMKCPRQWQDKYLLGNRGPGSSGTTIGTAVHTALNRLFQGQEVGNYWQETVEQAGEVVWKDNIEKAQKISEAHIYHYWESVGKWIADDVVSTERELLFNVEGVDIPILGYVDLELKEEMIDYKTTAWTSKGWVKVQPDWKFQQGLYQLVIPKPSQVHVLTRAKTDPIIVPQSTEDKFYFGLLDREKIIRATQDEWERICYHFETYGVEMPWPGNSLHEWAGKYCGVKECCAL
jgi:hypothetical protein